jgi:hypothetical protein
VLLQLLSVGGPAMIALAIGLVMGTVVIHAAGFAALLRAMMRLHVLSVSGFWRVTLTLIGLTFCLVLIHLAEISIWGVFYFRQGCLPDFETALYFSGGTYTTAGYGELTLAAPWRMFGQLEALTGILMCGLSTGLFFAVVSRWIGNWVRSSAELAKHDAKSSAAAPRSRE